MIPFCSSIVRNHSLENSCVRTKILSVDKTCCLEQRNNNSLIFAIKSKEYCDEHDLQNHISLLAREIIRVSGKISIWNLLFSLYFQDKKNLTLKSLSLSLRCCSKLLNF